MCFEGCLGIRHKTEYPITKRKAIPFRQRRVAKKRKTTMEEALYKTPYWANQREEEYESTPSPPSPLKEIEEYDPRNVLLLEFDKSEWDRVWEDMNKSGSSHHQGELSCKLNDLGMGD